MQQRHGHTSPRHLEVGRGQAGANRARAGKVRVCAADGCDTRLSAYNESELCHRHRSDARSPGWH